MLIKLKSKYTYGIEERNKPEIQKQKCYFLRLIKKIKQSKKKKGKKMMMIDERDIRKLTLAHSI